MQGLKPDSRAPLSARANAGTSRTDLCEIEDAAIRALVLLLDGAGLRILEVCRWVLLLQVDMFILS